MSVQDDEIDQSLRGLPDVSPPPELAARVHARARAAFEAGGAGRVARLATAAAVVAAVAVYLTWAVRFLGALAST
jgi:hypothetical protein